MLLPQYELPNSFNTQNEYLQHLCDIGAKNKYKTLSSDIRNRINFELKTIKKTGYPGYFLIVQDIIKHAKKMNISVGPGRGSVGGSVVAYCLDITTVDPMKYEEAKRALEILFFFGTLARLGKRRRRRVHSG